MEAVDLSLLQLEIVVDEEVAEAGTQDLVVAQRIERLVEAARQRYGLGLIGRIRGRPGIGLALQPIQPADDLARHIKVGIGGRLADPVLEMGRGSPGAPSTRTITPRLSRPQI